MRNQTTSESALSDRGRNANRQQNIPRWRLVINADGSGKRLKVLEQEPSILKETQETQIDDDGDHEPQALFALCRLPIHLPCNQPIHYRRRPQQQYEWRIPRRVENVAGSQQVEFFEPHDKGRLWSNSTIAKTTKNASELNSTDETR